MPELVPASHVWQVGLTAPRGRVCDTLVIPVDVDLSPLLRPLQSRWPGLAWVPPTGYAHLTLAAVGEASRFRCRGTARPVEWMLGALETTAYSLRARVRADLGPVAGLFAVPPREAYVTLAYALASVELGSLPRIPELAGCARRVQHRRFEDGCRPFAPTVVAEWTLDRTARGRRS